VILSGGISSEVDIKQVIDRGDGKIVGIITGKAVYESRFDLEKVFQTYQKVPKESVTW
jgi:phosphoribosylformimino-5-aminoimidazole carboxamide ribonucleotide (ProFAR) isomerase